MVYTFISSLPKWIEKLMEPIISVSFKNVLGENQHEFKSGMSTEKNLLCFYSN